MAMATVNFTIPEELARSLNERVPYGKRSAFVAAAIHERLERIESLDRELREGYQADREEGTAGKRRMGSGHAGELA